ncbi:MAG TPA: glycosyltransferase family 39 protein [Candidatus Hydrogenedentes bacterium]|nr:glycosyltransferase family 39 protein [Candidatus Hydrogenedentota bacterium]HPC16294.1 glycosyltransferase family 39 protein [Candidatus Hydrogenedentota bacterium]HRT20788.1 glycosyltransferase family 39 protein [Candidatus Hydrogenedentota bacterium]HRT66265.1 glycosyltransferase family 39 protein [Candidatus Hydrogenedentota bacterium]
MVKRIHFPGRWDIWAGACIVLAGAALRLYRLADQNLWFDEYVGGVGFLGASTYSLYSALIDVLSTGLTPPVYFFLQYVWARVVGEDILLLRMLPMAFGLFSLPLAYAVGARVFGRTAGLVALFCFAVAPAQIWEAKTLRFYAPMMFFCALSAYLFVRALQDGRFRWWAGCLAINVVAVFTHFFSLFLVLAEMVSLLAIVRTRFRTVATWILLQLLCIFPLFLKMYLNPPLVIMNEPFRWSNFIDCFCGESQWALAGVFAFLMLAMVVMMALDGLGVKRISIAGGRRLCSPPVLFLLILMTVPLLVAGALNHVFTVAYLVPRYLGYMAIGRFAIAGGVVACLPWRRWRAPVAVLLAAGCLYDLRAGHASTVITHWSSTTDYIRSNAKPHEPVLICDIFEPHIIRANGWDLPNPFLCVNNFQVTTDVCASMMGRSSGTATIERAWIIYAQCRNTGPIPELEHKLNAAGLVCEFREFPGWENLAVYSVMRGSSDALVPPQCLSDEDRMRCEAELNTLGLAELDLPKREKYIQMILRMLPDPFPYNYEILDEWQRVFFLLRAGEIELADAYARNYEAEPTLRGFVSLAKGDQEAARAAFEQSRFLTPTNAFFFTGIKTRLMAGDFQACLEEAEKLEALGHVLIIPFRDYFWCMTHPEAPRLPFGVWAVTETDQEAIAPFLESPVPDFNGQLNRHYTAATAIEISGRQAEAAAMWQAIASRLPEDQPRCRELEAALARAAAPGAQ